MRDRIGNQMFFAKDKVNLVSAERALPGRESPLAIEPAHFVNSAPLKGPYPDGAELFYVGLGCFWGAERLFWNLDGVFVTAVGYAGGFTPNPTYEEVCSGMTGHAEVVMVVYEPAKISRDKLLQVFWEAHDPTQDMRQGNDVGSQYRSGIYLTNDDQLAIAKQSRENYQRALSEKGFQEITTEVELAGDFYFAETYHQQYLAKNPGGYCGLSGLNVCYVGDKAPADNG